MGKTKIEELYEAGQSAWLDSISRSMIKEKKIEGLISKGLTGMTSNPTIFDKAISAGDDYDEQIRALAKENKPTFEIYDDITTKDIQAAADIFKPVYEKTGRKDGYVNLELNPELAYKTKETIEEGRRLYKKVNRPNVMLKVPSTAEGFEAVEELVASGININITLIFSLGQYLNTARAYINGIRRLLDRGEDASAVHSVASVFVSRIDTAVDSRLDELLNTADSAASRDKNRITALKGKAAVANSAIIYKKYLDIFIADEFKKLEERGANKQRVLWGSTSTKNPGYSDIKYVTELIADNTVNTMPLDTFEAFLDHGKIECLFGKDTSVHDMVIKGLKELGIDIDNVCLELLKDGVVRFEESFRSLLKTIDVKSEQI